MWSLERTANSATTACCHLLLMFVYPCLQECTLFNLGIMFDLAYRTSSGQQARHHIASSLARSVPDDLDLAAIAPEHSSNV
jgi:hypothetical protein